MPAYDMEGTIKLINETQTFNSGFTKREFVITTDDDRYPQSVKFESVKDKIAQLDGLAPGQRVKVTFDIRGNEYNGKYYVSLTAWKVETTSPASAPPIADEPPFEDDFPGEIIDEETPF